MHCSPYEGKRRKLRRLDHCALAKKGFLVQGRVPALLNRATNDTTIAYCVLICSSDIHCLVFFKGQLT